MRKVTIVLLSICLILSLCIAYLLYLKNQKTAVLDYLNSDTRYAVCKTKSDQTLLDINIFCNLMSDQLSQEQCLKTDYVSILSKSTGPTFLGICTGVVARPREGAVQSVSDVMMRELKH